MEIQNIIEECQNLLYKGFLSAKQSDINWLNLVCGELLKLFKHLHKLLIFDSNGNSEVIESCFLCASQIICCIKNLENVIKTEIDESVILAASRQFFLDRILWCLAKIKSTATSIQNNDIIHNGNSITDINFVNYMDIALDLVSSLTTYINEEIVNVAERNAEILLESVNLRSVIDSVISHALAFANVVEANDKKSLTAICQKVLRECISYESECSIASRNETNMIKPDEKNRRLKAELLENALIQLETLINDCLLRLVFTVFVDISLNPIDQLKQLNKNDDNENDQTLIDLETEKFDLILDRLMQIGIFAIVFAVDSKVKSTLRSCLASLESLDMNLIPSIFSNCQIHTNILEKHWQTEINILQYYVQEIIDTNAFCKSFIDILSQTIDQLTIKFDINLMKLILHKADILYQHFNINYVNLKLNDDKAILKIYYDDYKLMLKECKTALEIINDIDIERIMKRLKIFYSVNKKLQKYLQTNEKKNLNDNDNENIFENIPNSLRLSHLKIDSGDDGNVGCSSQTVNNIDDTEKFFETFGIQPSSFSSILYKTKKDTGSQRKKQTDSMIVKLSKNNLTQTFRSRKQRMSLRIAMFKKQKSLQTVEFLNGINADTDTLDLHITDILDQLTDLSGTLSGPTECITIEENNTVRIQVNSSN